VFLEWALFSHLYKRDHLEQVLLTYGLILVFEELRSLIVGNDVHGVNVPDILNWSLPLTDTLSYPAYRLFMSAVCLVLAVLLYLVIRRTRLGMMIRAGSSNREMVQSLGLNINLVYRLVFALGVALAAFAGMIAAPVSSVYPGMGTKVLILAIFALSLDLLVGYTGLVSFGHAAFYGIGAYALGLLAPKYDPANLWLTLAAAVACAGLAALIVGVFVVRARGIYFIMVTLAFAQMFYFVFHDTKFGGGSDGISMNFKPVAAIGSFIPFNLSDANHVYYFVFAALVTVFLFLRTLSRSSFGRALQGIRSNEER